MRLKIVHFFYLLCNNACSQLLSRHTTENDLLLVFCGVISTNNASDGTKKPLHLMSFSKLKSIKLSILISYIVCRIFLYSKTFKFDNIRKFDIKTISLSWRFSLFSLLTCLLDNVLILWGEIIGWSLNSSLIISAHFYKWRTHCSISHPPSLAQLLIYKMPMKWIFDLRSSHLSGKTQIFVTKAWKNIL